MDNARYGAQFIVFRRIKPWTVEHFERVGLYDTYEEANAAVIDPAMDWIVAPVYPFR